ncbi:MAG: hypothetical protein J6I49_04800 [Bacteroidales bacterium]|nr:hypothetical protein [Bacteroidales bacterium]
MQEQNHTLSNRYGHEATLRFFRRWWKVLTIVFVAAAVVSLVVSLLITPRFKSTAVIIPSNSNRLSKAIMSYHYSMDFMDYGSERDCEYAIQILSSKQMQHVVFQRFNLAEHYEIPADHPHPQFQLETLFEKYISLKRTEYMGLEISVMDKDPQMAADIANFMAAYYDTLCREIHHDRAESAARVMAGVCAAMEAEIDSIAAAGVDTQWKKDMLADKCKQLADLQTRATQTRVDKDQVVSYKYVVDPAVPADKKAYPKRLLVVVGGSVGALVLCILCLMLFAKPEEE